MATKLSKTGKRLGRPPKNKETVVTESAPALVESKPYVAPEFDFTDEMIECKLVPINQFSHINTEDKKFGRYAQSTYSTSKFGKNAYVVLAYLETDLEKHRKDGLKDEQIVVRCVNYLNQEEQKKKGQKKESKKPYGNLQLYNFKVLNKSGKEIIGLELVTDARSNENFWGVGNR